MSDLPPHPVVKRKRTKLDITLEGIAILLIVVQWWYVLAGVLFPSCLSSEIFRLEKWRLFDFAFPAIATCVILFITYRIGRPKDCFVGITGENAERQYLLQSRFRRFNAIFARFDTFLCFA